MQASINQNSAQLGYITTLGGVDGGFPLGASTPIAAVPFQTGANPGAFFYHTAASMWSADHALGAVLFSLGADTGVWTRTGSWKSPQNQGLRTLDGRRSQEVAGTLTLYVSTYSTTAADVTRVYAVNPALLGASGTFGGAAWALIAVSPPNTMYRSVVVSPYDASVTQVRR